jgi:uncharacterized protein (DUF1697 family)
MERSKSLITDTTYSNKKMNTYIVLLRGVMPTGRNRVPMAQLRQVMADEGFQNVRTYIQSGNVILRSKLSASELENRIHYLIKEHIGADLTIVARTRAQLQKILAGNPFQNMDISRVFFTVFSKKPEPEKVNELVALDYSPEKLAIHEDAAYLFIPGNAARSKLSNNFLEKKLGVSATTRNFNTTNKLIELSKEN